MNFLKTPFLMLKLTPHPVRTVEISLIVKLHALFRLVFIVNRCGYHVLLLFPVSELAFVTVATVLPIRLDPILAHLRLILRLVTLRSVWNNKD